MVLRLSRNTDATVLYVLAVGCKDMCGPFFWHSSTLEVRISAAGCVIRDSNAGFILTCDTVGLISGDAGDLELDFDAFLEDCVLSSEPATES
jgi:hypothetical protein